MSALAHANPLVFAGLFSQIDGGHVLTVRLSPDVHGRPREAIILCDAANVPRAYLNLCRHLPVPLDAASRDFLCDGQLQCATHGARYRIEDGSCVAGPCQGSALHALSLFVENGELFVADPPPSWP